MAILRPRSQVHETGDLVVQDHDLVSCHVRDDVSIPTPPTRYPTMDGYCEEEVEIFESLCDV